MGHLDVIGHISSNHGAFGQSRSPAGIHLITLVGFADGRGFVGSSPNQSGSVLPSPRLAFAAQCDPAFDQEFRFCGIDSLVYSSSDIRLARH